MRQRCQSAAEMYAVIKCYQQCMYHYSILENFQENLFSLIFLLSLLVLAKFERMVLKSVVSLLLIKNQRSIGVCLDHN